MSRAKPITTPLGDWWRDKHRDGQKATHDQLELLAAVLDLDMDDLLDEFVTQGEVARRLNEARGRGIPTEVLQRRDRSRAERQTQPRCRSPHCGREGDSTKHHFVNKWILKELDSYQQKWADRTKNCIPVCIDCHRDLHDRRNGPQSIAAWLSDEERDFAERALSALAEERPKLLVLIARGSDSTYETRLVRDWFAGDFRVEVAESQPVAELRAVA